MARREVHETVQQLVDAFGTCTFTTVQAVAQGIAAHRLRAAVSAGLVLRLHRGHYRLALTVDGAAPSSAFPLAVGLSAEDEARLLHGVDRLGALGIPAFVGERSALALWGLPDWGVTMPACPVLMVPRGSGSRRGPLGAVTIMERDVAPRHVVTAPLGHAASGIAAVDPLAAALQVVARPDLTTAVRLAILHAGMRRQLQWSEGLVVGDDHELAYLLAEPRMCRALRDQASGRAKHMDIRGRRRLLDAVALADPRVETVLESISWAEFTTWGMDLPEPQATVRGASGRLWRVDFLFAGGVVGECDGALKYDDRRALWREKKRQEDLENAGFIVVRWTWEEIVYHPEVVRRRIVEAVARAALRDRRSS